LVNLKFPLIPVKQKWTATKITRSTRRRMP
jgi:hypothetical protein